ncbi:unnamed protein product [Gemmataceae bacterium]|nr:unnamed protein product [Gemmataceae bacterium]VTT98787.1 unnamed protein product [Gemmataceae bacterium]
MPAPAPPAAQFWLLTGEVPSGPFSVEQIHAKIAGSEATWQTLACPVGGSNWLPVVRTAGLGPPTPASALAIEASEPATKGLASDGRSTPALDPTPSTVLTVAERESRPRESIEPSQSTAVPNRPARPNPPDRFWLLVGAETTGPFRAAHIRAMFQSGKLSADAKARRIDTESWVPLAEAVGALPPRRPAEPQAKPMGPQPPAHTPFTPSPTTPPEPGTAPPTSAPPEPRSAFQIPGLPPQTIQMGIGVLIVVGLLGLAKGCKEDAKNQPTLQERLKESRNKNPLPLVPPPRTNSPPEQ